MSVANLAGSAGHETGTQGEEAFEAVVVQLGDIDTVADRFPGAAVAAGEQGAGIPVIDDLQEPMVARKTIAAGTPLGILVKPSPSVVMPTKAFSL